MDGLLERLMNLQLFAANPGGGDPAPEPGSDPKPTGGNDPASDPAPEPGRTFTQEDLDRVVQQRLARERKTWEQQIEDERKRAQMTTEEKLKAEKEEAEQRAKDAQMAANQRLISAEAKVQAVSLGVKPERVDYALRLADLSAVEVDDSGDVDAAAIKTALEAVIKDLPELKGTQGPSKSGGEFRGNGDTDRPTSLADAIRQHYNV